MEISLVAGRMDEFFGWQLIYSAEYLFLHGEDAFHIISRDGGQFKHAFLGVWVHGQGFEQFVLR